MREKEERRSNPDLPIFTRNFLLISFATFFSSFAQFAVLTSIPSLLTDLGFSSKFVGAFVGAFGLGALLVRLPVGRAIDRVGMRTFALMGVGSMSSAYLLYAILSMALNQPSFLTFVPFLLILAGLAHSLGFSTYGTAAHSFVALTVPKTRRGEAISYYGILIDAARALGSGLSLLIVTARGYPTLLVPAAIFAIVAGSLVWNVSSYRINKVTQTPIPDTFRLEKKVFAPAFTNGSLALSSGAALAFVPLLGVERGITNPGIFFTVISLTSILMRLFAGRFIDRYGRVTTITPGMILTAVGLFLVSRMASFETLLVAGLVYGVGFSISSIALQALAIDLGGPDRQGTTMATYFAMVDLGIGLGSITSGQIVPFLGYGGVFSLTSIIPVIGLCGFLIYTRNRKIPNTFSDDMPKIPSHAGHDLLPVEGFISKSKENGTSAHDPIHKKREIPMPKVKTNGVELFYQEFGDGDEIVISGQMRFRNSSYQEMLSLPPTNYHVFNVTLRGYGESTRVDESLENQWYPTWAEDIYHFSQELGVEKFVYTGASHGAVVGWHLANSHPAVLKGLVSVVGAPHDREKGQTSTSPGRKAQINSWNDPNALHAFVHKLFEGPISNSKQHKRRQELIQETIDYYLSIDKSQFSINPGKAFPDIKNQAELANVLSTIHLPVLILGGAYDPLCTPEVNLFAAKSVPGAKLILYQDAGHMLATENPERVLMDIKLFIDQINQGEWIYTE